MTRPTFNLAVLAAVILAGCGGTAQPPVVSGGPAAPSPVVLGAPDTAGATLGSPNALYTYRFKMSEPGSSSFNYRDRDLTFYFRPTATALYFKVENLQGRPVWINWDQSAFQDAHGRIGKVAHSTTRWRDRFATTAQTQVPPQQQISEYVFSMDDLLDAGAGVNDDDQPHRPILPEDQSAPSFTGRTFGVDLQMLIDDKPRTYTFRFQVASVIPR